MMVPEAIGRAAAYLTVLACGGVLLVAGYILLACYWYAQCPW